MFSFVGLCGVDCFAEGKAAVIQDQPGLSNIEDGYLTALGGTVIDSGRIHRLDLIAAESQTGILAPYQAKVWTYNGKIPGPIIRIQLGDTLEVNLLNKLKQPTSIHWHGVRLPNAVDGVPGLTQQAVASGARYIYRFKPKDAGTFWFHPHVKSSEQIEKGLHGVLIVEDPKQPHYSQDLVWILDDWLLDREGQIVNRFVTRHDLAHDGRWGNFVTINGQQQPSFTVHPGERLRIRLVNVANGRIFAPRFPELTPRVIAVDGMLVAEPFPLDQLFLAPGNRLDLDLVVPKDYQGKNLELVDKFSRETLSLARLAVSNVQAVETPDFRSPRADYFPDSEQLVAAPVYHEFQLNAERGGYYGITWTIDKQAWPEVTPLKLKHGKFYRLRFSNLSSRLHPMHIHGQFFQVIARREKPVYEKYWRDTVLIGPKESVDIGLVPIDKGKWANHCHILEHAEAGMMGVITVE